MDLDELRALFSDMLNKGLRPMLCDAVVPDHDHLPAADEMQRMNDGCFKKSLNLWTEEKAPVKNKHYKLYLSIGVEMTRLLEEKA
jgi:hypothetical protein